MGKITEQTLHSSRYMKGKHVTKGSASSVVGERRPKAITGRRQPAAAMMRQTMPKAGAECQTHNRPGRLAVSVRSILHPSYK